MIPSLSVHEKFDGFYKVIPLRYLLLRSPVLSGLHLEKYEVPIVKALRSCANNELEIRMLVSAPSRSNWLGKQDNVSDLGGYEIRRKDWESVLRRPSMAYSRDDWEKRTLYMVLMSFLSAWPMVLNSTLPGTYSSAISYHLQNCSLYTCLTYATSLYMAVTELRSKHHPPTAPSGQTR